MIMNKSFITFYETSGPWKEIKTKIGYYTNVSVIPRKDDVVKIGETKYHVTEVIHIFRDDTAGLPQDIEIILDK